MLTKLKATLLCGYLLSQELCVSTCTCAARSHGRPSCALLRRPLALLARRLDLRARRLRFCNCQLCRTCGRIGGSCSGCRGLCAWVVVYARGTEASGEDGAALCKFEVALSLTELLVDSFLHLHVKVMRSCTFGTRLASKVHTACVQHSMTDTSDNPQHKCGACIAR